MLAKRGEAGLFEVVAVEEVVGVERDKAFGVGMGDVDAGLANGAKVEGVGVDELDDENAEEVLVREVGGSKGLGETAEEVAEGGGLGLGGVVGREEFEETVFEGIGGG